MKKNRDLISDVLLNCNNEEVLKKVVGVFVLTLAIRNSTK